MKKVIFNPSLLDKNHLPKMVSKRIFGSHRSGNAAYKSEGGSGEDDDDEKDKLLGKIKGIVTKELATRATKGDVEAIAEQLTVFKNKDGKIDFPLEALRAMADEKTGVMAKLIEQGLKIQDLQTKAEKEVKDLSVRTQVADWQKKNEQAIVRIKNGERNVSLEPLEIRAAAVPMTVGTVNSGSSPYIGRVEIEGGINPYLRRPLAFWDFIAKGRTNAPTYGWVNQTNPQGAAAFIAPGQYKPNVSFEFVAETSVAKKIADSAKAVTELLQDIDGMTTFIEQELKYKVFLKLNDTLMTGTASSTVPAGIRTLSTTYNLAAKVIKTHNPNNMDAIRAVIAQLRSGLLTGEITVFVNSIDAANMDLAKAVTSGVYMLPPFSTADGKSIAGARIIEDNNIPVGYMQAGFMQYYRVLIYKDFSVSWGWENDDFTKNMITAIGEMRLHQFFNSIYTGAFVYDTFAHVIGLIDQDAA